MRAEYIFPFALIALNLSASLTYGWFGDLNRCIYWLAAATLTLCVTLR